MKLIERDIEDIIYKAPWLLDERFVIADISGSCGKGRQINIGRNGVKRFIDLLFKDIRDSRPVIVELKKEVLARENIAQILEYRALIVSMDEKNKMEWQNEFGINYFSPKMMLIGLEVPEEVRISANLAGIDIKQLSGLDKLEVDFSQIGEITSKIEQWSTFLKSGNRHIDDRGEWVESVFDLVVNIIDDYPDDVSTCNAVCRTSSKNSYITEEVFPFINIPILYNDNHLLGLYEYYDDKVKFSNEHIYCDFVMNCVDRLKANNELEGIKNKVKDHLRSKGYNLVEFDGDTDYYPVVTIKRNILDDNKVLSKFLNSALDDAIIIKKEFDHMG